MRTSIRGASPAAMPGETYICMKRCMLMRHGKHARLTEVGGMGRPVQGYAVKAGMLVARGQLLLMMDADGATRVSDLGKLEDELHKLTTPSGAASYVMLPDEGKFCTIRLPSTACEHMGLHQTAGCLVHARGCVTAAWMSST